MRASSWPILLIACPLLASCAVTVPAPDLAFLGDSYQADPGSTDPGTDPGGKDGTTVDPGTDPGDDPGSDPGEDVPIVVVPKNGGYPCKLDGDCVSGTCYLDRCTCRDGNDCDKGLWCDAGETTFYGTLNCLPPRPDYSGCNAHVHCRSGACANTMDGSGALYCVECATGGAGCDNKPATPWCCGGQCIESQGCLADCGVMAPPAPQYAWCPTGCWDQAKEYCSPAGPAPKLGAGADCQYLNSWCLSNACMVSSDGKTSSCACNDGNSPCTPPASCFEGVCATLSSRR